MTPHDFIAKATIAATEARNEGAVFSVPIAVAQAALESAWGTSRLAREAKNLKGVKAGSSWKGAVLELPTREYREADDTWYTTIARWRRYPSWVDAFKDYGVLIERVYPHAAEVADDPRAFLEQLVARTYPKYATDPEYVGKVWGIVKQHNLTDEMKEEAPRLLLVYGVDGAVVARVALPEGSDVLVRASADGSRVFVRPDTP